MNNAIKTDRATCSSSGGLFTGCRSRVVKSADICSLLLGLAQPPPLTTPLSGRGQADKWVGPALGYLPAWSLQAFLVFTVVQRHHIVLPTWCGEKALFH